MASMKKALFILTWMGLNFPFFPGAQAFDLDPQSASKPVQLKKATVTPLDIQPGTRVTVSLEIEVAEEFSVYEDKIKMFPLEPDGMRLADLKMSPVISFVDFAGKTHTGLRGKTRLDLFAEIPKDVDLPLKTVAVDFEYIACTKKYCAPPQRLEVRLPVNIGSSVVTPQEVSSFEAQISQNLLWAFVLVFIFGFLTSLTPCVYPLIPITLAVIGARASEKTKWQAFFVSFIYVLGISVTYSILGLVAAKTGALFGQVLSYQPVVLAFVVLFVLMALSIYGYFEIRIPHFISRRLEKSGPSQGYIGAFSSGLIAGVVASPCVGPVLVGVLAYIAKTQNGLLGFALLFTFAMGMGVLFLLLGTFSSFFKKIPRSGGWMDLVKFILGTALLAVALWYLKPLVPPSWFLICVSLLSLAAIFIFIAKVYPKTNRRAIHAMPFVFAALVVVSPIVSQWQLPTESNEKALYKNGWLAYSQELVDKARQEKKLVIIDFFADWCAACVELDEKTFSSPEFIQASADFMLLRVDATETFPELIELQKKYEIYGLPTIILIDKNGNVRKDLTLTGFEELEPFMIRLKQAQ